jgi:hypothetical protein
MAKIGRNAPCPCGGEKKYKKCCLRRDQEQQSAKRAASNADSPTAMPASAPGLWAFDDDDDLEELSNSVVDLIDEKRFDEADKVCVRLRLDYPEVVDGIWRQAMVGEARGQHHEAAKYYRQSADFASREGGFEEEGIKDWLDLASRLEAHPKRSQSATRPT